jgi:hypothetical protein
MSFDLHNILNPSKWDTSLLSVYGQVYIRFLRGSLSLAAVPITVTVTTTTISH